MNIEIFDKYANSIAEQFHLKVEDLFTKNKRSDIVSARQMLYYLCYERPIRIASIRRYLNEYGYDVSHSTILHGYRKAKENVDSDKDYKSLVRRLQDVQ